MAGHAVELLDSWLSLRLILSVKSMSHDSKSALEVWLEAVASRGDHRMVEIVVRVATNICCPAHGSIARNGLHAAIVLHTEHIGVEHEPTSFVRGNPETITQSCSGRAVYLLTDEFQFVPVLIEFPK